MVDHPEDDLGFGRRLGGGSCEAGDGRGAGGDRVGWGRELEGQRSERSGGMLIEQGQYDGMSETILTGP